MYAQYLTWLAGALRGDFGNSFQNHVPVGPELLARLPVTLELALGLAWEVELAPGLVVLNSLAAFALARLGAGCPERAHAVPATSDPRAGTRAA